MALETIPEYLISGVNLARPEELLRLSQAEDEGELLSAVGQSAEILQEWGQDTEFWTGVAESHPGPVLQARSQEERQRLTDALGGDDTLASAILLDALLDLDRPQRAQQVVIIIQQQCVHVVEDHASGRRRWRAVKVLRRVFKAVGGGLMIAADIVVPDPSAILRVASVWGGVDMIIDAAE